MLTGYQCETVAWLDTECGGIICWDCARKRATDLGLARAERGLDDVEGLRPVSRYELDEHRSNLWAEAVYAGEIDEDDEDTWPPVLCDRCGAEIT